MKTQAVRKTSAVKARRTPTNKQVTGSTKSVRKANKPKKHVPPARALESEADIVEEVSQFARIGAAVIQGGMTLLRSLGVIL
jgi:hypothetical protein